MTARDFSSGGGRCMKATAARRGRRSHVRGRGTLTRAAARSSGPMPPYAWPSDDDGYTSWSSLMGCVTSLLPASVPDVAPQVGCYAGIPIARGAGRARIPTCLIHLVDRARRAFEAAFRLLEELP